MDLIIVLIGLMVPAIVILGMGSIFVRYFTLWIQAKTADIPVSLPDLLGMTFRKCNPKVVVETMVTAKQVGVDLTCADVQQAYFQGADLEKISAALVRAREEGMDLTFQELVETDLQEDRLEYGNPPSTN